MEGPVTCHLDFAREWRGGQRQVCLLAAGLAQRGLRMLVVTRRGSPLAERLAGTGVEVIFLRVWGEFDWPAARRVARIVREAGADILAAHASHPHSIALLARGGLPNTKIVVHRRVDASIGHNRKKYLAPDAYVAISEAVRRELLAGGVPEKKIHLVSSGVPPHVRDDRAKTRLAKAWNLDPEAPWVGCVADLVDHKGHDTLLRAWRLVWQAEPTARLVIIGDGPLRASLEALARQLGVFEAVRFVGRSNEAPAWMSALSVFALTSKTEGLGSSILDAMAARVPVVATAAGGIPELVRHEQTGLLAPVSDVDAIAANIIEALRDRRKMAALSGAAYNEIWRARSADAMVEHTLRAYREILSHQ
jgi:glycosyltransferase involved in cell wall biosynthesis